SKEILMHRISRPVFCVALALASALPAAHAADSYLLSGSARLSDASPGDTGLSAAEFDALEPALAIDPVARQGLAVWAGENAAVPTADTKVVPHLANDEFEIFARLIDTETLAVGSVRRMSVMGSD